MNDELNILREQLGGQLRLLNVNPLIPQVVKTAVDITFRIISILIEREQHGRAA